MRYLDKGAAARRGVPAGAGGGHLRRRVVRARLVRLGAREETIGDNTGASIQGDPRRAGPRSPVVDGAPSLMRGGGAGTLNAG